MVLFQTDVPGYRKYKPESNYTEFYAGMGVTDADLLKATTRLCNVANSRVPPMFYVDEYLAMIRYRGEVQKRNEVIFEKIIEVLPHMYDTFPYENLCLDMDCQQYLRLPWSMSY